MVKVQSGEDLTPYLSHKALKEGYISNQSRSSYWDDKDLVLNVTGFHHIHLDPGRTNDMLFVHITEKKLIVHGIFNHDVFDDPKSDGTLSDERTRMLTLHQNIVSKQKRGTFLLSALAGDGNPIYIVKLAQKFNKIINKIDPKISERCFIDELYKSSNITPPSRFNLTWQIIDSNLVLFDTKTQNSFLLS